MVGVEVLENFVLVRRNWRLGRCDHWGSTVRTLRGLGEGVVVTVGRRKCLGRLIGQGKKELVSGLPSSTEQSVPHREVCETIWIGLRPGLRGVERSRPGSSRGFVLTARNPRFGRCGMQTRTPMLGVSDDSGRVDPFSVPLLLVMGYW